MTALEVALQEIADANEGYLRSADVVEAARPAEHPAHVYVFNKVGVEAEYAYHLHRAGELIRSVKLRAVARELLLAEAKREADALVRRYRQLDGFMAMLAEVVAAPGSGQSV